MKFADSIVSSQAEYPASLPENPIGIEINAVATKAMNNLLKTCLSLNAKRLTQSQLILPNESVGSQSNGEGQMNKHKKRAADGEAAHRDSVRSPRINYSSFYLNKLIDSAFSCLFPYSISVISFALVRISSLS